MKTVSNAGRMPLRSSAESTERAGDYCARDEVFDSVGVFPGSARHRIRGFATHPPSDAVSERDRGREVNHVGAATRKRTCVVVAAHAEGTVRVRVRQEKYATSFGGRRIRVLRGCSRHSRAAVIIARMSRSIAVKRRSASTISRRTSSRRSS